MKAESVKSGVNQFSKMKKLQDGSKSELALPKLRLGSHKKQNGLLINHGSILRANNPTVRSSSFTQEVRPTETIGHYGTQNNIHSSLSHILPSQRIALKSDKNRIQSHFNRRINELTNKDTMAKHMVLPEMDRSNLRVVENNTLDINFKYNDEYTSQ